MSNVIIEHFPDKSGRMSFMEPSLIAMGQVMDQYVDYGLTRNPAADLPYMYTERATLSQFVGGIWRSNPTNIVLEEYASEKACEEGKYSGRKDIWFSIGATDCYAEAKQFPGRVPNWLAHNLGLCLDLLKDECDRAYANSALDREHEKVHFAMGIVFVPVAIFREDIESATKHFERFDRELGTALVEFTQRESYDMLRATFFRCDLFSVERCYEEKIKKKSRWLTFPRLETLICCRR